MKDFQENYSYLKFKKHKTKYLVKKYGKKFQEIFDKEDFVKELIKILSLFKDPHISVNSIRTYGDNLGKNYDYKLLFGKYFENKFLFRNKVGFIGFYDDILYINIFTWRNSSKNEINKLLSFFEKTVKKNNPKKIIVDIRSNRGGSDRFSSKFLSYFVPKKIAVCKYLFRKSKKNFNQIGDGQTRFQEPNKIQINAKVAVLIGKMCMSSNEYLVMGFEALKKISSNFILIGDKTFGSSGNPQIFKYKEKFEIKIPSWICYTSEGKLFEGNGVSPDIKISSKKSIINSKDKVFEKAINILNI